MRSSCLDPVTFDISAKLGFLSPNTPSQAFSHDYYKDWDDINGELPFLISSGNLQHKVNQLEPLDTARLKGEVEYRRAYVVLGFIIHGYVWSNKPPRAHVPPQLSEPFMDVCKYLGMEPVLSYAGLCIWNWRLRHGRDFNLTNMETLASFTGMPGEAAFYLVPVLVEYEGGDLMDLLMRAVDAANKGDSDAVRCALESTGQSIVRMGKQLSKLYATLDARFFYHVLRPFLAGGKGMESKGLPNGVILQSLNGTEVACKFAGGSAVQSSLFPFLDRVLGISHQDLTVYDESLAYMPGAHREFLAQVSTLPSLRNYVEANASDEVLIKAFNQCMREVKSWRGQHIAIVSKFIVQPAREADRSTKAAGLNSDPADGEDDDAGLQGTGGSVLMPFLRRARDATVGIGI